jgi:hypothetical protein
MVVGNLAWLRWGGQAIEMSYSEMPKRVMNYNSQGKRRVEISEARKIDVENKEMRKAGVITWGIEAKDRDETQSILEQASVHLGI